MSKIDYLTGLAYPEPKDDYEVFEEWSRELMYKNHFAHMKANLIISGLETIAHVVDDVFSWTSILLIESISGKNVIPTKSTLHPTVKQVTLRSGYFLVCELPASMSEDLEVSFLTLATVPKEDYRKVVLGYRSGNVVYLKNGNVINV